MSEKRSRGRLEQPHERCNSHTASLNNGLPHGAPNDTACVVRSASAVPGVRRNAGAARRVLLATLYSLKQVACIGALRHDAETFARCGEIGAADTTRQARSTIWASRRTNEDGHVTSTIFGISPGMLCAIDVTRPQQATRPRIRLATIQRGAERMGGAAEATLKREAEDGTTDAHERWNNTNHDREAWEKAKLELDRRTTCGSGPRNGARPQRPNRNARGSCRLDDGVIPCYRDVEFLCPITVAYVTDVLLCQRHPTTPRCANLDNPIQMECATQQRRELAERKDDRARFRRSYI